MKIWDMLSGSAEADGAERSLVFCGKRGLPYLHFLWQYGQLCLHIMEQMRKTAQKRSVIVCEETRFSVFA